VKSEPREAVTFAAMPRARLVPAVSKAKGRRLPEDPDGKVWIADDTPDPPAENILDDADEQRGP
jgi:hypothetical protein